VQEAKAALTEAGYSDISRDHMVYALCALLDESVMNRGTTDDGYLTWRRDPLQAHFFGTLNAGEELWERIRNLLKETAPDTAVLTCMYRTLQLGFVGSIALRMMSVGKILFARSQNGCPPSRWHRTPPLLPAHHACAAAVAGTG
jgi:type VI secretion system protein ImpK